MSVAVQFLGALIATYFTSRAILWLLRGWRTHDFIRIGTAHALSWLGIALFVGYLKAYIGPFSFSAGFVYLFPQILWAVLDCFRRTRVI